MLNDAILISLCECTQGLTVYVPALIILSVLIPIYKPTHYCALLGYTYVHGEEQQPDLEILLQVKFNSCDVSSLCHELQLDKFAVSVAPLLSKL